MEDPAMAADVELLFLHALPFDGSMWDAQRSDLAIASHAPTLYGHGDDLVAWAAAALACARGSRLVVVGCSVGGSCALELARLAPDRVAALVLIGTKAEHNPDPALRDSALALLDGGLLEEAWGRFWQPLFAPGASSAIVERARQGAMNRHPADLARGVSAFHARRSRADMLASFGGPVLVVTGQHDTAPGIATSERQAAMARNGTLHVIPGSGHYVPLERPDAMTALLSDLLASLG